MLTAARVLIFSKGRFTFQAETLRNTSIFEISEKITLLRENLKNENPAGRKLVSFNYLHIPINLKKRESEFSII